MKKILLVICLFTLCGCTDYIEINDLGIVTGIGIDYNNDFFEITTQMIINERETSVKVYNSKAKTIEKALAEISKISNKQVFLSDLKVLLITDNVIKKNINYYDYFLRNTKSKMDFLVYVSKSDEINDILNIYNDQEGSSLYVDKMMEFNDDTFSSSTKLEFIELVQLTLEYGINPVYPTMSIKKSNNEEVLYLDSLVSYNKENDITVLDETSSIFYNIVTNNLNDTILSINCGNNMYSISIDKVKTNYKLKDNTFYINVDSSSQINSYECEYDLNKIENTKKIENITNNYFNKQINELINIVKEDNNDFIGFGNYIYKHNNDYFNFKDNDWDLFISNLEFKVQSNNKIITSGEIRESIGDKYVKNK